MHRLNRLSKCNRNLPRRSAAPCRGFCIEPLEERTMLTLLGQSLFPADNPWNQRIDLAPVAPNSAAIMNTILAQYGDGTFQPDFGQDYHGAARLRGIPYNVVHGNTTPKVPVIVDAYARGSDLLDAPIPPDAVIQGDLQNGPTIGLDARRDSHLIVWDADNNIAYEFFRASRPSENADGQWHADAEAVWDMKTNTFRKIGWTSADAAGVAILPGLVRPDEGLPTSQGGQGAINHAIRFTLQNDIILNQFIYPASHVANPGNTDPNTQPPMGARFRLKAGVDISTFYPQSQIIAQALKRYGLIVSDNGSNFYVSGASNSVDTDNNQVLTWSNADLQDPIRGLKSLTYSDFEVVDLTPTLRSISTTGGDAGIQITIAGKNFSGAAGRLQVLFGDTPATSVNILDDGHLTAVVPPGRGTVDVRIQSGISDPDDPQNIKSPIFGYGISPITPVDRFTYISNAATHLTINAPTIADAGAPFTFTVRALDDRNYTSLSYLGTIHFTSSDPQVTLPDDYTFTAADRGSHTFTITLRSAGPQSITATDIASPTIRGSSRGTTVKALAAIRFSLAAPATVTATVPFSVMLTAYDPYGNRATSYTGSVRFTSSDPAASLPPLYTFTAADSGRHTFSDLVLRTAGSQLLTVASSVLSTRAYITVAPQTLTQAAPETLPAMPLSGAQVITTRTDNSNTATVFLIDHSTDGHIWNPIATLRARATGYANSRLRRPPRNP